MNLSKISIGAFILKIFYMQLICARPAIKSTLSEEKNRHKILSVKNFVTGKIIRHFLPTMFLPGYLKTLIEF